MKKGVCVFLTGLFLIIFSSYVKAENTAQQPEMASDANVGHHEGMMKLDKMKDSAKMKKIFRAMMVKDMIASQDGGIIVLVGNKLQKYDKDLVLQKEVEIQVDLEDMKKAMPCCPAKNAGLKIEEEKPLEEAEQQEEIKK